MRSKNIKLIINGRIKGIVVTFRTLLSIILLVLCAHGCVGAGAHLSFLRTDDTETSSSIPVPGANFNEVAGGSTLMESENFRGVSGIGSASGGLMRGTQYQMVGLTIATGSTRLGAQ